MFGWSFVGVWIVTADSGNRWLPRVEVKVRSLIIQMPLWFQNICISIFLAPYFLTFLCQGSWWNPCKTLLSIAPPIQNRHHPSKQVCIFSVNLSLFFSLKLCLFVWFAVRRLLYASLVEHWRLAMGILVLLCLLLLHDLWIKGYVVILLLSQMLLKHPLLLHHIIGPSLIFILIWVLFNLNWIVMIWILRRKRNSSKGLVFGCNIRWIFHEARISISSYNEMCLVLKCIKATVFKISLLPKNSITLLIVRDWSSIVNNRFDADQVLH